MQDMKTCTITIRLDKDLDELLTKASRRSGKNRSEIAREALRRQLRISQFDALRQRIMPFAEARGYLTDEDVFAEVS
jgi:predicted transcriptional regulator